MYHCPILTERTVFGWYALKPFIQTNEGKRNRKWEAISLSGWLKPGQDKEVIQIQIKALQIVSFCSFPLFFSNVQFPWQSEGGYQFFSTMYPCLLTVLCFFKASCPCWNKVVLYYLRDRFREREREGKIERRKLPDSTCLQLVKVVSAVAKVSENLDSHCRSSFLPAD